MAPRSCAMTNERSGQRYSESAASRKARPRRRCTHSDPAASRRWRRRSRHRTTCRTVKTPAVRGACDAPAGTWVGMPQVPTPIRLSAAGLSLACSASLSAGRGSAGGRFDGGFADAISPHCPMVVRSTSSILDTAPCASGVTLAGYWQGATRRVSEVTLVGPTLYVII